MAIIIKGGTIVTAEHTFRGDVLCVGESIAAIGLDLEAPIDAEVVDALEAVLIEESILNSN